MYNQLYSQFGFASLYTPSILVIVLAVGIGYFILLRKKTDEETPLRKKIFFVLGLVAVYFGAGSPLYITGHFLFSIHMLQMSILYFAAPVLLLLGTPAWVYQPLFYSRNVFWRKTLRFLTHPAFGLIVFHMMLSFYHMPVIFDIIMGQLAYHVIFQTVLFLAALCLWWNLYGPLSEQDTLSPLKKWGLIVLSGVFLYPVCALIIFSGGAMYQTYTDPSAWLAVMEYCVPAGVDISGQLLTEISPMTPLHDQQLGGVIMKIAQEIALGFSLGYVFFQWVKQEKNRKPEEEYLLQQQKLQTK